MTEKTLYKGWRATIDQRKPGAKYFLETKTSEIDALSYFRFHEAESSTRDKLTRELSNWINLFGSSDQQVLNKISKTLKSCPKRTLKKFWTGIEQEEQQRELDRSLSKRIYTLRSHVEQLEIDSEALTKEALGGKLHLY
jgi:intergrase/recombinase